ncbi:hypothetical protein HYALB_00005527 [Hymenoscyphus albidus]|uniref:Uncharacterized protein n=1 Tax=Hymenoscyphus albidus TaxID=595503 RepID=A0A9N9LZH1_9HELO|nr:hypothetical protein HYALB_00005527 [Hymenoscyphus albidus]
MAPRKEKENNKEKRAAAAAKKAEKKKGEKKGKEKKAEKKAEKKKPTKVRVRDPVKEARWSCKHRAKVAERARLEKMGGFLGGWWRDGLALPPKRQAEISLKIYRSIANQLPLPNSKYSGARNTRPALSAAATAAEEEEAYSSASQFDCTDGEEEDDDDEMGAAGGDAIVV